MLDQRYWNEFFLMLSQLCSVELITAVDNKPGQLRLQCRVPTTSTAPWLAACKLVHSFANTLKISLDLSREYTLLPEGDWRWAWRLILQHPELEAQLPVLVSFLRSHIALEEKEIPLHASPNRHQRVREVT